MFAALEPRIMPGNINRRGLRFLGGTENFDLWEYTGSVDGLEYIGKHYAAPHPHPHYPLRIHRVAGGSTNWDVFKVPLHLNKEINSSMPPADRRYAGHWNDVTLSAEDVQIIEAYLRCFAPGVLGPQTNEEPT